MFNWQNILSFNEKFSTKFSINVLLIQTRQLVFLIDSNRAFVKSEHLYIFLLIWKLISSCKMK